MSGLLNKFFHQVNARVAVCSTVLIGTAATFGAVYSDKASSIVNGVREAANPFFSWYYVALVAFLLFFMAWLGTGRYKNVRLGHDYENPEFTFGSWVAMLFAAGTGVGLLFWAVAQPIMQFQNNPFIDNGGQTSEAAMVAMRLTFFHWGLNGWAIYSFVALTLGYFAFRCNLPLTIRSALHPLLGKRIYSWLGDVVDIIAVFATVFGIVTTLGLGVQQMNSGLGYVFGLQSSTQLQLIIIAVLMAIATVSVVSGIQKGMRRLSQLSFWLSIFIAICLITLGPTQYLFALTIEALGAYGQHLLEMSFYTGATRASDWQAQWTVFFWGWWLAWSPFVGMFIARISRGRTFREFVMGVLLVPTCIVFIWLGLLGGTAIYHELFGNGGIIEAVSKDVAVGLFTTIDALDLSGMSTAVSTALILLIAVYLVTAANAGTLVVNTILANGNTHPPKLHRILWGILLALLTGVLLVAGGLKTLQSTVVLAAFPFSLIVILMIFALLRALRQERYAAREGSREEPPREPWGAYEHAHGQSTPEENNEHKTAVGRQD